MSSCVQAQCGLAQGSGRGSESGHRPGAWRGHRQHPSEELRKRRGHSSPMCSWLADTVPVRWGSRWGWVGGERSHGLGSAPAPPLPLLPQGWAAGSGREHLVLERRDRLWSIGFLSPLLLTGSHLTSGPGPCGSVAAGREPLPHFPLQSLLGLCFVGVAFWPGRTAVLEKSSWVTNPS